MGTDIHPYVEYDDGEDDKPFCEASHIHAINGGELLWNRNYSLFDALGEGRHYHFRTENPIPKALVPPRGIPRIVSLAVEYNYYRVVDDQVEYPYRYCALGPVSEATADEWLAAGQSHPGPPQQAFRRGETVLLRRVSNATWHSPSWLTRAEIVKSLELISTPVSELSVEVGLTIQMLDALEERFGVGRARLVFWFDN